MASPTGIEPVTYPLGGDCAIQLCHGDFQLLVYKKNRMLSIVIFEECSWLLTKSLEVIYYRLRSVVLFFLHR